MLGFLEITEKRCATVWIVGVLCLLEGAYYYVCGWLCIACIRRPLLVGRVWGLRSLFRVCAVFFSLPYIWVHAMLSLPASCRLFGLGFLFFFSILCGICGVCMLS